MSEIIKKYDFIISLGRMCHVSAMLANNGLKVVNGPWDWSGTAHTSTIYNRLKSLRKGFRHWFDEKDFVDFEPYKDDLFGSWCYEAVKPVSEVSNNAPHQNNENYNPEHGYFNMRTKTYYLHDFYERPSFKEQFPTIAQKYHRRMERTLNFIKNSNSVLLVYMNHIADQRKDMPLNEDKVIRLMAELRNKYSGKTIDLYMFDHSPYFKGENFQRIILDVGIIRYVSNHDEVFPPTDTDTRHIADGLMMPQSVCYVLSKILLTDRHKVI